MKNSIRLMAMFLVLAAMFAFCACGKDSESEPAQTPEQESVMELPDGSEINVKFVQGTVGDYTIGYNPENFSYSSDLGIDTFTYTNWDGERNIYYCVYLNDMEASDLADGLIYQNSDRYEDCNSSYVYLGEYEAIMVWCSRAIDAPDYDMHFLIIESTDGCYVVETQVHSSMYGEMYVETHALMSTICIKNAAADTEDNCPEPIAMVGEWERTRTMVEGYEEDSAPGACKITIKGDSEDNLSITYTSKEFPDNNYKNKALIIADGELYYKCGNDCWTADVDYIGNFDTTFALTLTEDDTLILQNYFLIDGAPAVSYEFFKRAG